MEEKLKKIKWPEGLLNKTITSSAKIRFLKRIDDITIHFEEKIDFLVKITV